MMKITIIIILILLLVITLYSYYCLSSRMINFERARLEYILQKEAEITEKEKNIKVISDCSNKNEQLTQALASINKIIRTTGLDSSNEVRVKNNNIVKGIENIITGKIDSNIVANPEQINQSCINTTVPNPTKSSNQTNLPIITNTSDIITNASDINQIISKSKGKDSVILSEVPVEYITNY